MIDAGLVDEVRAIAADPGSRERRRRRSGTRKLLAHLDGARSVRMKRSNTIITRTRQFAVRQERWFRRDPRVRWIDVEHDPVAEAVPVVLDAIDRTTPR